MMRLRHVIHVTFLQVKQNWPVLLHRIEPNSNTATQIQSACNCASGCNHWVDLSTPPSNFPNYTYTLQNAELCVSPCQEVTSPQADAQCQVKKSEYKLHEAKNILYCFRVRFKGLFNIFLMTRIQMQKVEIKSYKPNKNWMATATT